ncbi:MAG: hypothetical protein ACUVTB_05715 [Candidatus Bathycorpusculaceae bacterium]
MSDVQLNVEVVRKAKIATYSFTDYFKGFENVDAVRHIFGEKTEEVLRNLRVEFFGRRGYMGVSDEDGHLFISADYLNNGDLIDIYLDVIHELVHVKQFMEGEKLFDDNFSYVERPTEIEAYRVTVEEAKRLGLNDERILQYLKTEWMSEEDLKKLAKTLNVKYTPSEGKSKRRRL